LKKVLSFFVALLCLQLASGQTSFDTLTPSKMVVRTNGAMKIENLGTNINTDLAELRPTISADGNLLFYIIENHPYNTKYNSIRNSQDIWFAERDKNGQWGESMHLEYPLNTYHYNAVYWISPDNNRILIRNAFVNGDYVGNGVSMCYRKKNGNWSPPEMLKIRNYFKYDRGRQNGATMAHDGQTLFLYMTEQKGGVNNDIYVCFLLKDGTWSEPKSLGNKINLADYDELTPYLASDGETLYFSSNRPGGLGDNDIWITRRLDSTWQKWSDPINAGSPINTEDWDAFFTLDAGGEYAYMVSNQDSYGESDIVRVRLKNFERPKPVVMVTGNVYNSRTKEPIGASLVYQTLPGGAEAGNALSSPEDGSFKIVLPFDKNYLIRATADHFFAQSENLNLDSLVKEGYKLIRKDLFLVPIEIGAVVRLNNVFFDFDKWDLRPESFVELDRVVRLLAENPAIEIEMSAHTDSYGSDDYNITLSGNRARSVMEYILSKGISPTRIISQGYGESRPVVPNDTPENRQLNRRVEFKILKN
jgi:outer membrane protein OmpA-like peptidoglycan-associated protein